MSTQLPQVLVIDDFFGRAVPGSYNHDRTTLCEKFGLKDITQHGAAKTELLEDPCAEAVFFRGQLPDPAAIGDTVTNDLNGCVSAVVGGWQDERGSKQPWAMILLDLCFYTGTVTKQSDRRAVGMPEGQSTDNDPNNYFGIEILRAIREVDSALPVVILSSKSREDVNLTFSELNACGFLARDTHDSPLKLREYLKRHALVPDFSGPIVGTSRSLLLALRKARLMAETSGSVLIRGEPGTGKELFARFIHNTSARADQSFEARSLASISCDIAESELFGHSKGSFTGAIADRQGAFEVADHGTLFLDEIGDANTELQSKLLRVLETGEIHPVGRDKARPVDVRVISATNIDIENRAARGDGFREDLIGRLRQAGTLWLPPLRDRKDDIPLLTEHFTRQAEDEHGRAMRRKILPETISLLQSQEWPGNLRDLKNCIAQAVMEHPDLEYLTPSHIHSILNKSGAAYGSVSNPQVIKVPGSLDGVAVVGTPTMIKVIEVLRSYDPNAEASSEWTGQIFRAQAAWSVFVANMVLSSIRATKRISVECPEGEVLIHPAMKLLTGDSTLSATKAADLIKRLLTTVPASVPIPCIDELDLKIALATAQRLRPSSPKASTD